MYAPVLQSSFHDTFNYILYSNIEFGSSNKNCCRLYYIIIISIWVCLVPVVCVGAMASLRDGVIVILRRLILPARFMSGQRARADLRRCDSGKRTRQGHAWSGWKQIVSFYHISSKLISFGGSCHLVLHLTLLWSYIYWTVIGI